MLLYLRMQPYIIASSTFPGYSVSSTPSLPSPLFWLKFSLVIYCFVASRLKLIFVQQLFSAVPCFMVALSTQLTFYFSGYTLHIVNLLFSGTLYIVTISLFVGLFNFFLINLF